MASLIERAQKKRNEERLKTAEIAPTSLLENDTENENKSGRSDVQLPDAQTSTSDVQTVRRPDVQTLKHTDVQTSNEKFYASRKLRKRKTIRIPTQKAEKYELWCFMNKVDFQDVVEKAMDYFIGRPDAHIMINDIEDNNLTDDVLIFYRKWTKNKPTQKDLAARETVRNLSNDICKIGIALSVYRAAEKINSFKYCIGAMKEAAATPIKNTNDYLTHIQDAIKEKKEP